MDSEVSGLVEAGHSGTTIEIKIKTMDSQTYTLQVDRQIPVPALKECIASVTGVVTDHQRLICRGKVLMDDQLLSAYHVEDGHTLHLVVREPAPLPSEGSPADSASDPSSSGNRGQAFPPSSIVVEAFSGPGQGGRGFSDVTRILSAVLGSMGMTNTQSSNEMRNQAGDRQEAPAPGSAADTTQTSPEQSGTRSSNIRSRLLSALGIPAGVPFGSVQAPVILDAVATLSLYLNRMREEFLNDGNVEENTGGASSSQRNSGASRNSPQSENALPTPASLAELLSNTRQMLNQMTEERLLQLVQQLENQENLTDSVARADAQSGSLRTGILLQNLGAYFLELGRTVLTLRFGQSPSEAVVNAGPAIYISPSGPNPLMVQPLPFQPGASFGSLLSESLQSGPGLTNGIGAGVIPRRIDIQIRRVPPSTQQTEPVGPQQPSGPQPSGPQPSGQRQASPIVIGVTRNAQPATGTSDTPSANSGAGVRVLPSRTTMAGDSDANRSQPQAGSIEFLYSLFGRNPNTPSGNLSSRMESQGASDMQTPESTAFQQNVEDSAGDGSGESVRSRTIEIDILTTGGIPSDANGGGQISADIFQMMRGLFPGGELHVESVNSEGTATAVTEQEPPSGTVGEEAEPRVTEEGLFLSRMLQHVMPLIETSIQRDEPSSSAQGESSNARNTRREDDNDAGVPSPKRQKTE